MRTAIAIAVALALVAGCAEHDPPPVEPIEPISLVEELDPQTAEWLARATNDFGFDLLAELGDGGNVVVSPVSISSVLTMLLNGAVGETGRSIASTLHVDDRREDEVNSAYASLLALLEGSGDVDLTVANSLWPDDGIEMRSDYVDSVGDSFGAEIDQVDLGDADTAERIDGWVRRETRGLIDGISEELGLPDPRAVLVLLNAVYFKSAWTEPFDPDVTRDGKFARSDGSTVSVPMMSRDDDILYGRGDGFQVVRLPYGDDERFAMEIFLPDGRLDEFRFDAARWADAVAAVSKQRILLALPRLELEYATQAGALDEALKALGMGLVYSPDSDFGRLSRSDPWLSTTVHKTYIRVDEEGTEAAAVTGGVAVTSAPPEFRVDRPFLFTIGDTETGAILFLGTVTDPTA
ncbi:MAG: serpin family protein [Actinomycetota bacterium]|nr:serpin family protein [Actinomycetota bacterium]